MTQFHSIRRRLAIFVTLGSLLGALVVGLVSFAVAYRAQHTQARTLQDQLVATVEASAAVAAFAGNPEIAREVVEGLLANPIVASAHIESTTGFSRGARQDGRIPGDPQDYPLFSPVNQADQIGRLVIQEDKQEIDRRALGAALDYSTLLIIQILISAALLTLLFDRVVGRHLTHVAHLLKEVPPGSSQRLAMPEGHQHNEIGMLVNSTNALLAAVERAIIEERKLQAEVDEMESHYKRIFETTNVGVMILRPTGGLINCNPTLMSRIVGVHFDSPSAEGCQDFINAIFETPSRAWAMVLKARDTGQTVARDLQLKSEDGQERWTHCMISVALDADGEIELIEGVLYDVTKRLQREAEARRAAETDSLTGLANRRGMELFIDQAVDQAQEDRLAFGAMMIDLDGFKGINDTYGHGAGDQVLKTVAGRLARLIRKSSDLAARPGGDEFTVVIHDCNRTPDLLERIASNMIEGIREPIPLEDGTAVQVGASIGIACYPVHGTTRDDLLAAADTAMYHVKRSGKNGYAFL